MNSVYIIDGDKHFCRDLSEVSELKYNPHAKEWTVCLTCFEAYFSSLHNMQIVIDWNIVFDNTEGGKDA